MDEKPVRVDIEAILKSKNPKLLKVLPGFALRYIKRILHQDESNKSFELHRNKKGLGYVEGIISEFKINIDIQGLENIPSNGRFVFASNHPLGGLESMVFMSAISKKHKNLKFLVNDILMAVTNLKDIFLPINKHGAQARESAKLIDEMYASDNQILVYPAGLVSRKNNGIVKDLAWQKSFVSKAKTFNRDIIPVYIDAKNSKFFYRLSSFRRKIGIKANLEMFYLIDEAFKQKGNTISIYFGKPISNEILDYKKYKPAEWADRIKSQVYLLKNDVNLEFETR